LSAVFFNSRLFGQLFREKSTVSLRPFWKATLMFATWLREHIIVMWDIYWCPLNRFGTECIVPRGP
jgi:hypothetical protein